MMREAVALVGGYGITEDCPGFLFQKWNDAQLEATYEGPEAVQRRHLTATMNNPVFLASLKGWVKELREMAKAPGRASAAACWPRAWSCGPWTLDHVQNATDPDGKKLYHNKRQGVTFPLADALCWLLGPYFLLKDILELEDKGKGQPGGGRRPGRAGHLLPGPVPCPGRPGPRASPDASARELVYGFRKPGERCCVADSGQAECAPPADLAEFVRLRAKADMCFTGSRLSKDRAGLALAQVMIPEALDYPV